MKLYLRLMCVYWFFCWFSVPCLSDSINSAKRSADKRLETPVSIIASRIYLGELLARLSQKTGVSLQIDDQNILSGIPITVSLSKVPLADALNAIQSLVSRKPASWFWLRDGEPKNFHYRLRIADTNELSAKDQVQRAFEKQVTALIEVARLPEKEREKYITGDSGKQYSNSDRTMMADKRVLSGIRIFAEALSPDAQLRVLRSQARISLPISQLSEDAKEYIQFECELAKRGDQFPETISFGVSRSDEYVSPILVMDIQGLGGHGYAGGKPLNTQLRQELESDWILPGDSVKHKLLDTIIQPSKAAPIYDVDGETALALPPDKFVEWEQFNTHVTEHRLVQLSKSTSVPVMAILPASDINIGLAEGASLKSQVDLLSRAPLYTMSKWKGNILLINYAAWFLHLNENVAWGVIKKLRRSEYANRGLLPLKDIAEVMATHTPEQLSKIEGDFPVIHNTINWRNVFVVFYRYPDVERLVPLKPEMIELFTSIQGYVPNELGRSAWIRIHEAGDFKSSPPVNKIHVELFSADDKKIHWATLTYKGRRLK